MHTKKMICILVKHNQSILIRNITSLSITALLLKKQMRILQVIYPRKIGEPARNQIYKNFYIHVN